MAVEIVTGTSYADDMVTLMEAGVSPIIRPYPDPARSVSRKEGRTLIYETLVPAAWIATFTDRWADSRPRRWKSDAPAGRNGNLPRRDGGTLRLARRGGGADGCDADARPAWRGPSDRRRDAEVAGATGIVLVRIAATARAMVERYASDAPDAIHDEAYVRLAGWLFDVDPSGASPGGPSALRASGAAALLAPYRNRRGGLIRRDDGD